MGFLDPDVAGEYECYTPYSRIKFQLNETDDPARSDGGGVSCSHREVFASVICPQSASVRLIFGSGILKAQKLLKPNELSRCALTSLSFWQVDLLTNPS